MTKKIAVSLPDDLVADAHEAVAEGRAASVSAYVATAMRQMRRESLVDIVEDWNAELGPPTAEDVAIARRVVHGTDVEPRPGSRRRGWPGT